MSDNDGVILDWDREVTLPANTAKQINDHLLSLQKYPKALRVVMVRMSKQIPVRYGDAINATVQCLGAAATAGGQSMQRRGQRDVCLELWLVLHAMVDVEVDYGDAPVPAGITVDLSTEDALEAWLDES